MPDPAHSIKKVLEIQPAFPIPIVIATPSTSHSFTDAKRAGSGCVPSFENPKNFARTSSAIIAIISSVWSRERILLSLTATSTLMKSSTARSSCRRVSWILRITSRA